MDRHEAKKFRALDKWFCSDQGKALSLAFLQELLTFQELLQGRTLLQLGSCGGNVWLEPLSYRNKWILSPDQTENQADLTSSAFSLPLERDSIDCLLAPFLAEASVAEDYPWDELDRVLKPMGFLIILGINPFSFWGLAAKLRQLRLFAKEKANLQSSFMIKRPILNQGYLQINHSSFYYNPPFKQASWLKRFDFMNTLSKMLCLYPAGFYCLILQKQQLISPSLHLRSAELSPETCLTRLAPGMQVKEYECSVSIKY